MNIDYSLQSFRIEPCKDSLPRALDGIGKRMAPREDWLPS